MRNQPQISSVDLNRHSRRRPEKLLDESSCRKTAFRQGRQIELADGQTWMLPAPPQGSEWNSVPFGPEYLDIIRAILEAEDDSEQRLAELSFAIYLLAHNYRLLPQDYERLLGSSPVSTDSRDWPRAFHQIAQDHVHSFIGVSGASCENGRLADTQGRFSRVLAWIRNHLHYRWFSLESREP
jgi:hypothetical protein